MTNLLFSWNILILDSGPVAPDDEEAINKPAPLSEQHPRPGLGPSRCWWQGSELKDGLTNLLLSRNILVLDSGPVAADDREEDVAVEGLVDPGHIQPAQT